MCKLRNEALEHTVAPTVKEMDAARENAHRQRSDVLLAGAIWVCNRIKAVIVKLTSPILEALSTKQH